MKRYAIIAATDKYTNNSGTPYCHNDAKLLKDTLVSFCDFAEQDILLHLLSPEVALSPSDLLTSIESVANRTEPGDTVIFYYAGHGTVDNGEPYLILPQTDLMNITQTGLALRDVSIKLRLQNRTNVRIFDACHSGYDVRDSNGIQDGEAFLRALITEQATGWLTFAACRQDESSHSDPTYQHGIFTYYLCEALHTFPPDTDIYPELLKIEVCKNVSTWCQTTNKVQTPTLNASISGNISIARSKKKQAEVQLEKNVISINETDLSRNEADIVQRLTRLRTLLIPGSKGHRARLYEIANIMSEIVNKNLTSIQHFTCSIDFTPASSANNMEKIFKKPIASFLSREKLQSFHEIRIDEIREDYPSVGAAAFLFNRPSVTYDYIVDQDDSWPKSFIKINVNTDSFLPSAMIFFYIIPLQIKACILRGIGTSSEPTSGINTFEKATLEKMFLDLNDSETIVKVTSFIELSIKKFNDLYGERVAARLDYLENELNR